MITISVAPTTTTVEGEHTTWTEIGQADHLDYEVSDSLLDWEPEGWYWPAGSIGGRFTSPENPVVEIDVLERCVQG